MKTEKASTSFRFLQASLRFLLSLFFLTQAAGALAQQSPVYIYGYFGSGIGSAKQFNSGLQIIFLKRHGLSIGYQGYQRKAAGIPENYVRRETFLDLPRVWPQEVLSGISFHYSYYFYPGPDGKTWRFPVSAGLLCGSHSVPGHYRPVAGGLNNRYEYDYDKMKSSATAVLLQAGFEYMPNRSFGLRAGAFGVLNKLPSFGITGSVLFGYVGSRRWREGE